MTTPADRRRAIKYARDLLRELADPKKTPNLPKELRKRIALILKNFPAEFEMEKTARLASDVFGPLYDPSKD